VLKLTFHSPEAKKDHRLALCKFDAWVRTGNKNVINEQWFQAVQNHFFGRRGRK